MSVKGCTFVVLRIAQNGLLDARVHVCSDNEHDSSSGGERIPSSGGGKSIVYVQRRKISLVSGKSECEQT